MDQERSPTMTIPELAQRMGVDQSTVWRHLRDGKLPGVHVGRRWLIDRARMERFLAGKEDAAGKPLMTAEAPASTPVLELVPRATQTETTQAITWLRGLMAALELLSTTVEATTERDAPRRLEA
jgi:excisionase family DNA binding protein